jgi:hypothetical protein
VEAAADRLVQGDFASMGSLDVGVWGWRVYREAVAQRLRVTALHGEDVRPESGQAA